MHPQRMVRQALRFGLLVTLVILALSGCRGEERQQEPKPSPLPEDPQALRPDEYRSEELKPSLSFRVGEGWTVGMVREYVVSMASQARESPKELLEAATERARLDVISAKQAVELVEKDLERMSRERLLPDEKTLEKVARYEAHLSRGLYKALHELEALQTRRLGGAAPLARLDVQGLES